MKVSPAMAVQTSDSDPAIINEALRFLAATKLARARTAIVRYQNKGTSECGEARMWIGETMRIVELIESGRY